MTKLDFIKQFYPYAKQSEAKTGMSALAILAQSAVETGWGSSCPGNMMFGVKDTDGVNGNEQLVTTFEYSTRFGLSPKQIGLATIESCKPVTIGGKKFFKYRGKAYFRKYATPEESFTDHAVFLQTNKRYAEALKVKADPYKFIDAIAAAGYAQSPTYATLIKGIIKGMEALIKKLNL